MDVGMDMAMGSLVAVLDTEAEGVEEDAGDWVGAVAGLAHPKIVNMRRAVVIAHLERRMIWFFMRILLYLTWLAAQRNPAYSESLSLGSTVSR